jgi:hypothetical protein
MPKRNAAHPPSESLDSMDISTKLPVFRNSQEQQVRRLHISCHEDGWQILVRQVPIVDCLSAPRCNTTPAVYTSRLRERECVCVCIPPTPRGIPPPPYCTEHCARG